MTELSPTAGPAAEQRLNDTGPPSQAGSVQRRLAVLVGERDVGAGREEHFDRLALAAVSGSVQRRAAVLVFA